MYVNDAPFLLYGLSSTTKRSRFGSVVGYHVINVAAPITDESRSQTLPVWAGPELDYSQTTDRIRTGMGTRLSPNFNSAVCACVQGHSKLISCFPLHRKFYIGHVAGQFIIYSLLDVKSTELMP